MRDGNMERGQRISMMLSRPSPISTVLMTLLSSSVWRIICHVEAIKLFNSSFLFTQPGNLKQHIFRTSYLLSIDLNSFYIQRTPCFLVPIIMIKTFLQRCLHSRPIIRRVTTKQPPAFTLTSCREDKTSQHYLENGKVNLAKNNICYLIILSGSKK